MAAISPRWCSRIASSASASLYGATTVSASREPADPAMPRRWTALRAAHQLARRLDRDEHVVVVAVVAALELDDLFAAGIAAGDADGVHRRFGARVGEAHQVAAEAALDLLGQDDAFLDREGVAGAVRDALAQHVREERVRVAGGEHAEGHVEVDVVVAVGVPDVQPRPSFMNSG